MKEGTQANKLFVGNCRSFSTKIRPNNLDERVLTTELMQMVKKCKNKDGRYGNLIQIIGSLSTLKLAYLIVLRTKSNSGIAAKEIYNTTLDTINLKILQKISKDILSGKFRFSPIICAHISKSDKTALPDRLYPREKIVQKAIEMVLTAIFEEIFLDCNHGSRPGRSCHTALKYLQLNIRNASTYTWVIKGDIRECFDNISHNMILKGLKRKVDCPATLTLIKRILGTGGVLNKDLKKVGNKNAKVFKSNFGISFGVPKGLVLNPLFNNIVLHELDIFINEDLKKEFVKGKKLKANFDSRKLRRGIKSEKDLNKRRGLFNKFKKVSSKDFHDSDFKGLHYVRYVDDWVVLVAGSFGETKEIRKKISNKLKSLGLTLNLEKTPITSLRKGKCSFLGINFFIRKNTDEHHKPIPLVKKTKTIYQKFAPRLILQAPIKELLTKLMEKGYVKRSSKGEFFPIGKTNCIPLTHPQILNFFNNRIQGILNYYSCVQNRNELWSIVRFLHHSCALTLARKYKLKTLSKTFKKFGRDLKFLNEKGEKYIIFKPTNLKMLSINERFNINQNYNIDKLLSQGWSKSLIRTQFEKPCVLCGTIENIKTHQIKFVKNVRVKAKTDAQRGGFEKKTIPLCKKHHLLYHSEKLSKDDIKKLSLYRSFSKWNVFKNSS
jgi:retron-type reverse transcriptase